MFTHITIILIGLQLLAPSHAWYALLSPHRFPHTRSPGESPKVCTILVALPSCHISPRVQWVVPGKVLLHCRKHWRGSTPAMSATRRKVIRRLTLSKHSTSSAKSSLCSLGKMSWYSFPRRMLLRFSWNCGEAMSRLRSCCIKSVVAIRRQPKPTIRPIDYRLVGCTTRLVLKV